MVAMTMKQLWTFNTSFPLFLDDLLGCVHHVACWRCCFFSPLQKWNFAFGESYFGLFFGASQIRRVWRYSVSGCNEINIILYTVYRAEIYSMRLQWSKLECIWPHQCKRKRIHKQKPTASTYHSYIIHSYTTLSTGIHRCMHGIDQCYPELSKEPEILSHQCTSWWCN